MQGAHSKLTRNIIIAMIAAIIIGIIFNQIPQEHFIHTYLINGLFDTLGLIFIILMKMLVVPIVFISLVDGVCHLSDVRKLGRIGVKTIGLYLITTCVAITLALLFAKLFAVGSGAHLMTSKTFQLQQNSMSLKQMLINSFPQNPIEAMANGKMIQVIVFAILLGIAIAVAGKPGERIASFINDLNSILLKFIGMILYLAPYGVFCLIVTQFAQTGVKLIVELFGYFMVVLLVLLIHVTLTNSVLLVFFARLNPLIFFRKIFSAMIFAFSTSSSTVSIPVTLTTVENKLGVKNSVAAFVIPLGATINMDGTAIMQGVATIFIANAYNLHLSVMSLLMVIVTATLASIGTAGVPGVGLITLAVVLQQVGLPVEGIALIIGVDRLLDMVRTAVNIAGDSAVACIVGKSEQAFTADMFSKNI